MARIHVRFNDGFGVTVDADTFGRFNSEIIGFYQMVTETEYRSRLFGPPVAIEKQVQRWTMLVPQNEVRFVCPAQAIEAGTAKTEGLGPQDESAVGKADAPESGRPETPSKFDERIGE